MFFKYFKCLYVSQAKGVTVTVSTRNVCRQDDVKALFAETSVSVGGVFHLAMVSVIVNYYTFINYVLVFVLNVFASIEIHNCCRESHSLRN